MAQLKVNNQPNNQSIGVNYLRDIPIYVSSQFNQNPQQPAGNVRVQRASGNAQLDRMRLPPMLPSHINQLPLYTGGR